jgi:hypothetical protein
MYCRVARVLTPKGRNFRWTWGYQSGEHQSGISYVEETGVVLEGAVLP